MYFSVDSREFDLVKNSFEKTLQIKAKSFRLKNVFLKKVTSTKLIVKCCKNLFITRKLKRCTV